MQVSARAAPVFLTLLAAVGVPLARAFTRVPPGEEVVVELAREGFVRRAGGGRSGADLERVSAAVVAAPGADVTVHSRCVEAGFSFLSSGRWFYDVEVAPEVGAPERYWLEVVDLPGGPALFGVDAASPVPGCLDR